MSLYYWTLEPNHKQGSAYFQEKSLPMLPIGPVDGSKVGILPGDSGSVTEECEVFFLSTVDYLIGFGPDEATALADALDSPFRVQAGKIQSYRHRGGTVHFAPLAA